MMATLMAARGRGFAHNSVSLPKMTPVYVTCRTPSESSRSDVNWPSY